MPVSDVNSETSASTTYKFVRLRYQVRTTLITSSKFAICSRFSKRNSRTQPLGVGLPFDNRHCSKPSAIVLYGIQIWEGSHHTNILIRKLMRKTNLLRLVLHRATIDNSMLKLFFNRPVNGITLITLSAFPS